MKVAQFLAKHPVFTVEELGAFLTQHGSGNRRTRDALLAHHLKQGHILRVRRGLYASVPLSVDARKCPVNPHLIAAKMTDDAVLAYHTALELHGRAHSVFFCFYCLSRRRSLPVTFRAFEFRCVLFPKALRATAQEHFGVQQLQCAGLDVWVTSLERTLVDVLDRPDLGGGWEEIWRSLESAAFLNLDEVIHYALLLGNATTVAKVGFYLDQHRDELMVEDAHLEPLRNHRPRQPHYLDRSRRERGRLVADWNLVVPDEVLHRHWAAVL